MMQKLGKYRLLQEIGAGSLGQVYLAEKIDTPGQPVSIKTVDICSRSEEEICCGLQEIRVLSSVEHPNIVRFHEAFVETEFNVLWYDRFTKYSDGSY